MPSTSRKPKPRYLIIIARVHEQQISTHDAGFSRSFARLCLTRYKNRAEIAGYTGIYRGPNDLIIYSDLLTVIAMVSIIEQE